MDKIRWLAAQSGATALWETGPDAWIICALRASRMFAFGFINLILALFFHELGFSDSNIGYFFTCTLLGDVLLSLLLTAVADRSGRRNILMGGSLLMLASGVAFAVSDNYYVLLSAAVFGVISVSGSEIGPFRAIEESVLSQLTTSDTRTFVLTHYVVFAALGTALGVAACGYIVEILQARPGWSALDAYHAVFWVYALVGACNTGLSFWLSNDCEVKQAVTTVPDESSEAQHMLRDNGDESDEEIEPKRAEPIKTKKSGMFSNISQESRGILIKLCLVMGMDSLASGMVPYSFINYYMDGKYHLSKEKLGSIMSVTWALAAVFNMFAGPIAKRIGLIKTMVCTHLPSAVFLAMLPVPQSLGPTIALLFARACLSSMDQAPRSAFIAAIVKPDERTAVMGIVNVCKTLAQSAGPWTTGGLAQNNLFWVAFVAAGSLKGTYDVLLLVMFLRTKVDRYEPVGASDEADQLELETAAGTSDQVAKSKQSAV